LKTSINLITFRPVNSSLLSELIDNLIEKFHCPVVASIEHSLPQAAFNEERNQYLADAFLRTLRDFPELNNSKLLGITEVDLYSTGLSFVFGQADIGGRASIISLARLYSSDTGNGDTFLLRLRALKEAVHELGHTFKLEHCRDIQCVMHFSTFIADTDIKSVDFCPRHLAEVSLAQEGENEAASPRQKPKTDDRKTA